MNTTKYNDFEEKNRKAELGGGADKIEKQHAAGKMTARERINLLVDKDSLWNWISWLRIIVPTSAWRKTNWPVMPWLAGTEK